MHGCRCSSWPRKSGYSEYCCGSMKRTRRTRRHRGLSSWPLHLLLCRWKKRRLNRLLPPYPRGLPQYPFRCSLPKPCPWKDRRRPTVPRHRWFPWDATASAGPLPRRLPNRSLRADAVRSAIARRFTFRAPVRHSNGCWIAGACRPAAVTGATTAMWFSRDSGFPRICPPRRSGNSAPAAATPDARKRRQPTIRP